ncbi:hypothetical protein AB0D38_46940, partial [Streptomyces sp. NPDC048279]
KGTGRRRPGSVTTETEVAGMTGGAPVFAYEGEASWGGFTMVSGGWHGSAPPTPGRSTAATARP